MCLNYVQFYWLHTILKLKVPVLWLISVFESNEKQEHFGWPCAACFLRARK